MKVAVIPARGGSKRIPRKNIKEFHGRPMIVWSIEAAIKSKCFDLIIVSTDDDEISEMAQSLGALVPFKRPGNLSDDYATTGDVMAHAAEYISESYPDVQYLCCIYATAPFIKSDDILHGLELLTAREADYAISVTTFPFPIQRGLRLKQGQSLEMFQPEFMLTRSQDLEEAYHDAGQFYWGTKEAFLSQAPFFTPASAAVILPRLRVQDIDTPEDWQRAEALFKVLEAQGEL